MCYGMNCLYEHPYTGECTYYGCGVRACPDEDDPEYDTLEDFTFSDLDLEAEEQEKRA